LTRLGKQKYDRAYKNNKRSIPSLVSGVAFCLFDLTKLDILECARKKTVSVIVTVQGYTTYSDYYPMVGYFYQM